MNHDTPATILVADGDPATRTFLADELTADGYELLVADCASDALRLLGAKFPDLVILDVGLPDGSGLEVLRRIRAADPAAGRVDPDLPSLVLSARSTEVDRVRAFEQGADDFLGRPFSYPELRCRVAALLRRADNRRRPARVRVGELEVDPSSRAVSVGGIAVDLTQKEYALLRTLAAEPSRVFSKDELLRTVWGFRSRGTTRTLDSHACRLRAKLAANGGRYVVNVWGVGYRLVDVPSALVAA
jgi:DNA-binding response OmpR family regulator